MERVTVARNAMATRFEIALHGRSTHHLRAAAEEALDEVQSWEARLSLYRPASEIAHVNARAAHEPVLVSRPVFDLIQHCAVLQQETSGLFDITIGPLVRCWGFMGNSGQMPDPEQLIRARQSVGMHLVQLDASDSTIRFARPGVMLDLGAIGKGFAIEKAAECLREAGVESALLHGGTSTVVALGHPPDEPGWKIAIESGPQSREPALPPLTIITLRDSSLSVSAVWGRCFKSAGQVYGHVIDPRSGESVRGAVLSAVITSSATDSDALSTALLTGGEDLFSKLSALRDGMKTLLAVEREGRLGYLENGGSDWQREIKSPWFVSRHPES